MIMKKVIVVLLGVLTFGLSGGSVYASEVERAKNNASSLVYAGEH